MCPSFVWDGSGGSQCRSMCFYKHLKKSVIRITVVILRRVRKKEGKTMDWRYIVRFGADLHNQAGQTSHFP